MKGGLWSVFGDAGSKNHIVGAVPGDGVLGGNESGEAENLGGAD